MKIYFLFHGAFIPIASIIWIFAILELFNVPKDKKKWIRVFFISFWMTIEIIYLFLIFTNTILLGTLINEIQVDYAPFSELFLLIALMQLFITTLMLGMSYWKSDDRKIKIRGKFLVGSIFMSLFACLLEVTVPIISLILLARILITLSVLLFYAGFIMPLWLEKLLLRK